MIQERWNLVDLVLLRPPRYEVELRQHRYAVRGSRYGEHFYEIFRPCRKGGEIEKESLRFPFTGEGL